MKDKQNKISKRESRKKILNTELGRLINAKGKDSASVAREIVEAEIIGKNLKLSPEELDKNIENNEINLYRYAVGNRTPQLDKFLLMIASIGCTLEEITPTLKGLPDYLQNFSYLENKQNSVQKDTNVDNAEIVGLLSPQPNELDIAEVEEEFDFEITKLYIKAHYTKNPNTLTWSKTFRIKSKIDKLQVLERFDYFKCVREDGNIRISYPKDLLRYEPENALNCDDNELTFIFVKPLQWGEEVEFTVGYFCERVINYDMTFHYIWVKYLIDELILEVMPPDIINNQKAEVFVSNFRGRHLANQSVRVDILDLDRNSNTFRFEKHNPELYTTWEIYWR